MRAPRPSPKLALIAPLALGLGTVSGACSSAQPVTSTAPPASALVDGTANEWLDGLNRIDGQKGITVGVRNDGEDLYLAVVVTDPALLRQIAFGGLTAWFDPEGGRDRTTGVRFPLGFAGRRPPAGPPGPDGLPAPPLDELELLRGDEEAGERRRAASTEGLTAAGTFSEGQFVYELRVPLRGEGFAVGANPGDEISIGLETPEMGRPDMGDRPEGGFPGGRAGGPPNGGPPRGGGMPGGRPGGPPRGGGGMEPPEPLKQWLRVTLAGS